MFLGHRRENKTVSAPIPAQLKARNAHHAAPRQADGRNTYPATTIPMRLSCIKAADIRHFYKEKLTIFSRFCGESHCRERYSGYLLRKYPETARRGSDGGGLKREGRMGSIWITCPPRKHFGVQNLRKWLTVIEVRIRLCHRDNRAEKQPGAFFPKDSRVIYYCSL